MKTIFDEMRPVNAFTERFVNDNWRGQLSIDEHVFNNHRYPEFEIKVVAYYDKATSALVIDLSTNLYPRFDWRPADRKVLELHETRESALRRVIAVADDWYTEVNAAIPAPKSDEQLLAEYKPEEAEIPY